MFVIVEIDSLDFMQIEVRNERNQEATTYWNHSKFSFNGDSGFVKNIIICYFTQKQCNLCEFMPIFQNGNLAIRNSTKKLFDIVKTIEMQIFIPNLHHFLIIILH